VTAPIGFESIAAGAITLRPWEPPDVSFVYDACQDPEIQRWTNLPSPFTAADAIALLHLSSSLREEGKAALFAIASTDQGELFGAVSVREVDHRRRQALIGYWVALEARRRGAATHAVAALSPWAMETLDLDEVYADVLQGNEMSMRVLERCGYDADGEGSCTQRGLALPSTRYVFRRERAS
jgi:RimJ/RimL family protein N-acetyltransferase